MKRICRYCGEFFETQSKHAKVCPDCKERNHKEIVMNNLFTETHKIYN